MKTFVFSGRSNYGLVIEIYNANSLEEAKAMVREGSWVHPSEKPDITELDTTTEGGVYYDD